MSEIKRYTLECNCDSHASCPGKMKESPNGEYSLHSESVCAKCLGTGKIKGYSGGEWNCDCNASEVEALPKRIKELEDQLQQKQENLESCQRLANIQSKRWQDRYERLQESYDKQKELLDRMAESLQRYVSGGEQSLMNIHIEFERLINEYKNLER